MSVSSPLLRLDNIGGRRRHIMNPLNKQKNAVFGYLVNEIVHHCNPLHLSIAIIIYIQCTKRGENNIFSECICIHMQLS